jgi:trans-aconitate methyltransferase
VTSTPDPLAEVTAFEKGVSSEAVYDAWAATYDADLIEQCGYNSPALAAGHLVRLLADIDQPVMDFGCGAGLVGQELLSRDVSTIDGLDFSKGMFDVAAGKGIYRALLRGDLTAPLAIDDNAYAGATCIGSMGNGHIEPEHVLGLIRTVQPGGPIVVYSNADGEFQRSVHDLRS